MRDGLDMEQWAAIRALVEGAAPTQARVAACAGVNPTTVSNRAGQEGWRGLDFRSPRIKQAQRQVVELAARLRAGEPLDPVERGDGAADGGPSEEVRLVLADAELDPLPDLPPAERAARLKAMLTVRVEELLRRAESGRSMEGRQVAALAALAQLAERVAALTPDTAARPEKSDDEVRAVLKKIDDRIVHLARGHARRILVARGMSGEEAERAVILDAGGG